MARAEVALEGGPELFTMIDGDGDGAGDAGDDDDDHDHCDDGDD